MTRIKTSYIQPPRDVYLASLKYVEVEYSHTPYVYGVYEIEKNKILQYFRAQTFKKQ